MASNHGVDPDKVAVRAVPVSTLGAQEDDSIMVKKTVRGLMALAVLWLGTGAAQARDLFKNAQADVFVLGGASTLVDPQSWSTVALYHSRMDLGAKFTIGVSVPYGKILSIESAYTYGPNNLVVTNENHFPHVGQVYPVRAYIGSLDAVVRAPFSFLKIQPYGVAGVEYDRFSPTSGAISMARTEGFGSVSTAIITHNDKVGLNIGVGLDRKIFKRVSFRIDVRDHATGAPAFGLPPKPTSDSFGASYPATGRVHNIVYTAGFVFHLGKL